LIEGEGDLRQFEREWSREWIEHTSCCELSERWPRRDREREGDWRLREREIRSLSGRATLAWFERERAIEGEKKWRKARLKF
jgi:hypothetical protein